MSTGFIITLLFIAAISLALWLFFSSLAKTLRAMEDKSEDAYWILDDAKKIIDEAEVEEPKSNSSN